jgi:hypothetical protein
LAATSFASTGCSGGCRWVRAPTLGWWTSSSQGIEVFTSPIFDGSEMPRQSLLAKIRSQIRDLHARAERLERADSKGIRAVAKLIQKHELQPP